MGWTPYDEGRTAGERGSEGGITIQDEQHPIGARITLERGGATAPYSITCGLYGWMVHTRFFREEAEASAEFARMKNGLATILALIPNNDDPECDAKSVVVGNAIHEFVQKFPT